MSEAKVKNFLLLAGGRNKKLVNHKGSNFGGPDGVSMSSLICYNCLKFSRIISNYLELLSPLRGYLKLDYFILIYAI